MGVSPGRPRAASPQLLEDAAVDSFIEHGYGATTVDAIAQRAGVSRNTFFNYFGAKSDVLWFGADVAIDAVRIECARRATVSAEESPVDCARAATRAVARAIGNDRVPLALTQLDVMGSKEEIRQSGLVRVGKLAAVYRECAGAATRVPDASTRADAASAALAAAAATAWVSWAHAGVARKPLVDFVDESFSVLFSGFDSAQW
jgi:AcrR family transcriptional regulator